ncbi:MAG TPA: ABC transporter transmembrane domain-containing protein, partial [Gemmatimonadaceae bacterium]
MAEPQQKQGKQQKPKLNFGRAWAESRELIWRHRRPLAIGLVLMLVSRLTGLVLPGTSKYFIDNVLIGGQVGLLVPLALAAGAASLVSAVTSFTLAQVVSITAQRAIADLRVDVQRHVLRLPVSYFDSVKTGQL